MSPDLAAAHDRMMRVLAVLRLAGPATGRFAPAVERLLAQATGDRDFAAAQAALGLAKRHVREAWSSVFDS